MTDAESLLLVEASKKALNLVYEERNRVIAGMCRMAQLHGWRTWLGKHEPADDPTWDHEWTTVVFIELPNVGQVSWHIHDRDLPLFEHVPMNLQSRGGVVLGLGMPRWDGHTTEEKYGRLRAFCEMTASAIMNPETKTK